MLEKDNAAQGEAILTAFLKAIDKGIDGHQKKWHPICDPKELDQTLKALRSYWEQQRRSNDER